MWYVGKIEPLQIKNKWRREYFTWAIYTKTNNYNKI